MNNNTGNLPYSSFSMVSPGISMTTGAAVPPSQSLAFGSLPNDVYGNAAAVRSFSNSSLGLPVYTPAATQVSITTPPPSFTYPAAGSSTTTTTVQTYQQPPSIIVGRRATQDVISTSIQTAADALAESDAVAKAMRDVRGKIETLQKEREKYILQARRELQNKLQDTQVQLRDYLQQLQAHQLEYNRITQQVATHQRIAYYASLRAPAVTGGGTDKTAKSIQWDLP